MRVLSIPLLLIAIGSDQTALPSKFGLIVFIFIILVVLFVVVLRSVGIRVIAIYSIGVCVNRDWSSGVQWTYYLLLQFILIILVPTIPLVLLLQAQPVNVRVMGGIVKLSIFFRDVVIVVGCGMY